MRKIFCLNRLSRAFGSSIEASPCSCHRSDLCVRSKRAICPPNAEAGFSDLCNLHLATLGFEVYCLTEANKCLKTLRRRSKRLNDEHRALQAKSPGFNHGSGATM